MALWQTNCPRFDGTVGWRNAFMPVACFNHLQCHISLSHSIYILDRISCQDGCEVYWKLKAFGLCKVLLFYHEKIIEHFVSGDVGLVSPFIIHYVPS